MLAAATTVVIAASVSGAVTGSVSGFESADGNMILDGGSVTTKTSTDWNCFSQSPGFVGTVTAPAACKVSTGATNTPADANGEVEWTSGQKFDTKCPKLSTGNNPPKDEFTDVTAYTDTDASNKVYFYGGAIRSTANGNSSGDVEFNQVPGDDVTTAGCRTAGDRLLAYDFLNGGTTLNFHVLTWIDATNTTVGGNSGKCFVKTDLMPCFGANVLPVDTSKFDGASNQATIAAVANAISGQTLAVNQFSEFGVNLTDALLLSGCISFPQQVWESRSSGSSFTSNPQDIEVQHRRIQTCGEVRVIKQTDPRGQDQVFSFSSNIPARSTAGGAPCSASSSVTGISASGAFCLNDKDNADKAAGSAAASANSAANTVDATNVPQGTYGVTEGTEPGAFSFGSVSCSADSSSGSSVTVLSTAPTTATITLKPSGVVTCVYTNDLHSGAIVITKTGKDKNCATATTVITKGVCTGVSTAALSGATFDVTADAAGAHPVAGGSALVTGASGTVCLDGLPWSGTGTPYYVTETAAPFGYGIDDATANRVSVVANASCSDANIATEAASYAPSDSPLTDVDVTAGAQVSGATQSHISCVDADNTDVGDSPQPTATGYADPAEVSATGLTPGTYTCTVVVDP